MSEEAYLAGKLDSEGYPGYPATSQADVMKAKHNEPGMYQTQGGIMHEAIKLGAGGGGPRPYHQGTRESCAHPQCREYVLKKSEADMKKQTSGAVGTKSIKDAAGTVDPKFILGILQQPAINVERQGPRRVVLEFENVPNDQALRILLSTLPTALELYLKKSKDYGGNVMDRFGLGEKAAIPDMARKFGKLIDSIWHDKPLAFEQTDEILQDLLGHILIILDQRRTDQHMDDLRSIDG